MDEAESLQSATARLGYLTQGLPCKYIIYLHLHNLEGISVFCSSYCGKTQMKNIFVGGGRQWTSTSVPVGMLSGKHIMEKLLEKWPLLCSLMFTKLKLHMCSSVCFPVSNCTHTSSYRSFFFFLQLRLTWTIVIKSRIVLQILGHDFPCNRKCTETNEQTKKILYIRKMPDLPELFSIFP